MVLLYPIHYTIQAGPLDGVIQPAIVQYYLDSAKYSNIEIMQCQSLQNDNTARLFNIVVTADGSKVTYQSLKESKS